MKDRIARLLGSCENARRFSSRNGSGGAGAWSYPTIAGSSTSKGITMLDLVPLILAAFLDTRAFTSNIDDGPSESSSVILLVVERSAGVSVTSVWGYALMSGMAEGWLLQVRASAASGV